MPGKMTQITAVDTDTEAFAVPNNKLLELTRIQITNRANVDIRVRGWDCFTDTDTGVHSTAALPVVVFDYPVASQDAIVIDCADESKMVMGTLNLQSTAQPVSVYIGGKYKV